MNQVKPWLDSAGKFTVERIPCPHESLPVNLAAVRKGVLHTTEGHWDDGLAVFKTHYAPHFLVGLGRIAQLVQVGTIGAALVHRNADAIVQIEVCGFSQQAPWMFDDATAEALAALMAVCRREYGIPLTHYWKDGDYGVYGDNPHRHAGVWDSVAGWYGHGDVPSLPLPNRQEDHWDPGALKWSELFARAEAMTDIAATPAWTPPPPPARPCACGNTHAPAVAALPPTDPVGRRKWIQEKVGVTDDGLIGLATEEAIANFIAKHAA